MRSALDCSNSNLTLFHFRLILFTLLANLPSLSSFFIPSKRCTQINRPATKSAATHISESLKPNHGGVSENSERLKTPKMLQIEEIHTKEHTETPAVLNQTVRFSSMKLSKKSSSCRCHYRCRSKD